MNACAKLHSMTVHPIVVKEFPPGINQWTDRQTDRCSHPYSLAASMAKNKYEVY